MSTPPEPFPRISPVGDAALLIELADVLDLGINDRVYALSAWLSESPLIGVTTWVPGYASLLVHYGPLEVNAAQVQDWLLERWQSCPESINREPARVQIPVRYGGEDGPDLEDVARLHQMTVSEVVRRHAAPIYRVGMMGFTPGFAYLMGLDSALATPRQAAPRTYVPAGAVGIAGEQTGIYPLASPGGWQLIGCTEATLFDPVNEPHFLLSPGDEVQFVVAAGSAVR